MANTGVGPRAYDDRGAYEYQAGVSAANTSRPDRAPRQWSPRQLTALLNRLSRHA